MAQSIAKLAKEVVFGDLMFSLGIPIPMRSYGVVRVVASSLLPIITQVPFQWLYPTGEKQDTTQPKHQKYFEWADVIAGDFLIIKKSMPTIDSGLLKGKVLITNTVTAEDTQAMIDRKMRMLVTSTPVYDGRYYATNVYEGVLITLMGKRPEEVTSIDYEDLLGKLKWRPTIREFD
jgi:hypothetical protein